MINITDNQIPAAVGDPKLRALIEGHLHSAQEQGLADLTQIAVIEAGDTEDDMRRELGFSPLHNPLDGTAFGDANFRPHWDWLEVHDGWYELIYTVGNSGFAFIIFVAPHSGELAALCAAFAADRP